MENMIEMKACAPARDIGVITSEIKELCRQAQATALAYIVEIGRRLVEAKATLGHGEWGGWLRDTVGFSQSTANNYMRLFEEYGDSQMTIFGATVNSQTLGNLPYSKALALLAVPAAEREEFAEEIGAEDLSVKELERAIKERDEERRRADALKEKAAEAERAKAEVIAAGKKAEELRKKLEAAEDALLAEKEKAKKLRGELKEAKEQTKTEVVTKTIVEGTEELDKARAALKAAEAAKADAERREREAREELKAAKAALKTADPEVNAFKVMFDALQGQVQKCLGQIGKIREQNPEVAEKLMGAMRALAEKMRAKE